MQQLQPYLVILLPVLMPPLASAVAAFLAQDGWKPWINSTIAWTLLLGVAVLNMWLAGQLTGNISGLLDAAVGIITALLAGPLMKWRPWLVGLAWIQSNLFSIVPALKQVPANRIQCGCQQRWSCRSSRPTHSKRKKPREISRGFLRLLEVSLTLLYSTGAG